MFGGSTHSARLGGLLYNSEVLFIFSRLVENKTACNLLYPACPNKTQVCCDVGGFVCRQSVSAPRRAARKPVDSLRSLNFCSRTTFRVQRARRRVRSHPSPVMSPAVSAPRRVTARGQHQAAQRVRTPALISFKVHHFRCCCFFFLFFFLMRRINEKRRRDHPPEMRSSRNDCAPFKER